MPALRQESRMKKRMLQGFGLALVVASPMWLTMEQPPDYVKFGIAISLGLFLLALSYFYPAEKRR